MEVPQGNSLCSYPKQPKMLFFSSSSFLIKIGEREGRTGLAWVGRRWGNGEGG
jgi:hypothetical protein